ncbi:PREDICTED: tripartite motif-containing protein 66-like [Papilio polytes]|uniref:tripartite motif-containing protein 66-like n=1 Tax=Papilio polytes TaxID=76194 RepID=UPI00067679F6|nr:PREDICTED: tripartite motif-containing protein 66-like [Papilio polytes]
MFWVRIGLIFVALYNRAKASHGPVASLQHATNLSHIIGSSNPSGFSTNFSPRMDFAQWKPLTGRGDPLRNDPTYDYEPPVLERVHYWADEPRVERERIPERKSEVLVLGVSSRKPSVAPHQPPPPPKRTHRPPPPPPPPKFEDYTYKYSEYYPMTILVPPPPPPPGHQPSMYVIHEENLSGLVSSPKQPDRTMIIKRPSTVTPDHLSSFAVQEANLIYQSSTTSQNWFVDLNQTKALPNTPVTSDYAGWGPTTPFDDNDIINDTHNFISNDHNIEASKPYLFYKPSLSVSPKPQPVPLQNLITTFIPTALPPVESTPSSTQVAWPSTDTTYEVSTETENIYEEASTVYKTTNELPTAITIPPKPQPTLFAMLSPMMSMPLATDPDRAEDNLYAHASENIHVFKEHTTEDSAKLDLMQSMQPPAPAKYSDSTKVTDKHPYHVNPHVLNNLLHAKPSHPQKIHTHDPYLHMRFTTPMTTSTTQATVSQETKHSTEVPTVPMYLIIQGHSKVKTYSSKAKNNLHETSQNDISKHRETNEVKHLHPLKEKRPKKLDKYNATRTGKAQDLKSLIDNGLGSIEIQETDVGIKYDVSDGSKVPVELYKKGIVDSDENDYGLKNKTKREKRQIQFQDILNFTNESIEEYFEDFLNKQKNENLSAQNDTEDEDDDSDEEDAEDR